MVSSPAFAAIPAQVLNIGLSGTVPVTCSYQMGANPSVASPGAPAVTSVSLLLNQSEEQLVGFTVTCNDSNGYTVSASSTNGSLLKSGTDSFAYTVSMDTGTTVSISPSAAIYTRPAGFPMKMLMFTLLRLTMASLHQAHMEARLRRDLIQIQSCLACKLTNLLFKHLTNKEKI